MLSLTHRDPATVVPFCRRPKAGWVGICYHGIGTIPRAIERAAAAWCGTGKAPAGSYSGECLGHLSGREDALISSTR